MFVLDNNIDELLSNGSVERSFIKTPAGGDYSEAHFFDKDWNYTFKNSAVYMVIKEFNNNKEVINETVMVNNNL